MGGNYLNELQKVLCDCGNSNPKAYNDFLKLIYAYGISECKLVKTKQYDENLGCYKKVLSVIYFKDQSFYETAEILLEEFGPVGGDAYNFPCNFYDFTAKYRRFMATHFPGYEPDCRYYIVSKINNDATKRINEELKAFDGITSNGGFGV